jgi:uncharacterized membrane protein SpoIIM required for sporulation
MRLFKPIFGALNRCRILILLVFAIYTISVLSGIIMSQTGNHFALSYRDKIVGQSLTTDMASINYLKGNNFRAALYDFKGNLIFGAIPQTIMSFSIVIPCFTVIKQGWVGGIVSVDGEHKSRFRSLKSALYYFIVLLGQLIPYSIAIGAGMKCGIDFYNLNKTVGLKVKNLKIPKTSLADLGYVYIIVVPLFFMASCFEFLSNWNI